MPRATLHWYRKEGLFVMDYHEYVSSDEINALIEQAKEPRGPNGSIIALPEDVDWEVHE